MGIMVYTLLWVMQDFVHQPYYIKPGNPKDDFMPSLAESST